MKIFSILVVTVSCLMAIGVAQEQKLKVPKVEEVISPILPQVKGKLNVDLEQDLSLLVSTSDVKAGTLTWLGFIYLNAGWDTEAYRHFSQALRRDESCLMAHAGVALSLVSPNNHEFVSQRKAAVIRILELVELKVAGEHFFPEKERGFALATTYLMVNGRKAGEGAFANLAKRYPRDILIQLFHILLMRDGINALGLPNEGESAARKRVTELLAKHPENSAVMQFYLAIHANALLPLEDVEQNMIPVARKLAALGAVETWQHWLGMYEYRAGNLERAETAFLKSVERLTIWKKHNEIKDADAEVLWKSYLYLATVQYEMGKFSDAREIAEMFSAKQLDPSRLYSKGTQLILWEGWSLKLRMNLTPHRTEFSSVLKGLPEEARLSAIAGKSAAVYYYDFLAIYLALKKAAVAGDREDINELVDLLDKQFIKLENLRDSVLNSPESSSYSRNMLYMRRLIADAQASIDTSPAMQVIEYSIAVDNEIRPLRMLPPSGFYAFDELYIEILLAQKKWSQARSVLEKAITRRPSLKVLWYQAEQIAKEMNDDVLTTRAQTYLKKLK